MPTEQISDDGRHLFRLHASIALIDSSSRVLLVQEEKLTHRGKWNLPGGHVDHGEIAVKAAMRETYEETGLSATPTALLGIYSTSRATRFVFIAPYSAGRPVAGDQILDVRWFSLDEILSAPDDLLVSPVMLRQIASDIRDAKRHSLDALWHGR